MAIITIMLASVLGAFAGLFQLAFLSATLWQAFVTYLVVSTILSTMLGGSALLMAHLNSRSGRVTRDVHDDLERWLDWQAEEEMAADRLPEVAEAEAELRASAKRSA